MADSTENEKSTDKSQNPTNANGTCATDTSTVNPSLEIVINASLQALTDLQRAKFTSGVHFCPPHFVDHTFFTEEMVKAYKNGNFGDGPGRDYSGKIWEEVMYHALIENLPHVLEHTSIECMWVFYGLELAKDSYLLKQLSVNIINEVEIDILVTCLTKAGSVILIPIEVKRIANSNSESATKKATKQCEKNYQCLTTLLQLMVGDNLSPIEIQKMIQPVVFYCHDMSGAGEKTNLNEEAAGHVRTFNIYFDEYESFKFVPDGKAGSKINFLSWMAGLNVENSPSKWDKNSYQRLVCLLTSINSSKASNSMNHGKSNCYTHFMIGGKYMCMKGTQLCPKYIHKYVVKNVDFLTYLKTFIAKNSDSKSDKFQAFSTDKLSGKLKSFVKRYLTNMTNEQMNALICNEKRVVLIGDYGAGKTLVLAFKAMEILDKLENGSLNGHILFVSHYNALKTDIVPKFKNVFSRKTLKKYVSFKTWNEIFTAGHIVKKDFCFLDEVGETRQFGDEYEDIVTELMTPQENNHDWSGLLEQEAGNGILLSWIVIASKLEITDLKQKYPDLNDYKFINLSWQLRSSHSICHLIHLRWGKSLNNDTALSYPIYGARCRITHFSKIMYSSNIPINFFINEVRYWVNQLKTGSIYLCSPWHTKLIKKELVNRENELNIKVEDLVADDRDHTRMKTLPNTRVYIGEDCFGEELSGLEFDVVISVTSLNAQNWKLFSRAKYGISFAASKEFDKIPTFANWGRVSMITDDSMNLEPCAVAGGVYRELERRQRQPAPSSTIKL